MLEAFLLFITLAIPKAGVKIGSFPLYVSLISMAYFTARGMAVAATMKRYSTIFMLFCFVFVFHLFSNALNLMNGNDLTSSEILAFVLPMFSFFAYFTGKNSKMTDQTLSKIVGWSFYILCVYGLAQKVFGDYKVLIPGITANFSDAANPEFLSEKNNMIWGIGYLKLTSTYQNGNLFGVNLLVIGFLHLALLRVGGKSAKLSLALMIPVVLLTASVSVYIGLVAGLVYLYFVSSGRNVFVPLMVAVALLIVALGISALFPDNIFNQLITVRLLDRDLVSGAGRTDRIIDLFSYWASNPAALLNGSLFTTYYESHAYEVTPFAVLQYFGLGWFLFLTVFLIWMLKSIRSKIYRACVVAYLVSSVLDGAFWLPPTGINFFLLAGFAARLSAGPISVRLRLPRRTMKPS